MPIKKKSERRDGFLSDKVFADKIKTQITIWSNIYHRRKYKGLSQSELAKQSEVTQSIISDIENWDYNPSVDVLGRISNALGIKLELVTKEWLNWRFIEALSHFVQNVDNLDVLKAMKLSYFSDYIWGKILWVDYIRWYAGPFNKGIYIMEDIFEKKWSGNNFKKKQYFKTFVDLSSEDLKILDKVVNQFWKMTSKEITDLSYETEPMKHYKQRDGKGMWKKVL